MGWLPPGFPPRSGTVLRRFYASPTGKGHPLFYGVPLRFFTQPAG
ncbi:hypothetical protein HMPREF1324_1152 [Rothia aeria F0474]|uniref:Uncharacterized protein n=1 Tax=Rothia aeria F0474 TaxID=1125724 RepID=I0UU58_9MICC|nr:hypothetical protein HMPREF1324_1152 [Rothia aeria F0474]